MKLIWLREAALHLDKDDEDITEHVGPVLADVTQNIQVRALRLSAALEAYY